MFYIEEIHSAISKVNYKSQSCFTQLTHFGTRMQNKEPPQCVQSVALDIMMLLIKFDFEKFIRFKTQHGPKQQDHNIIRQIVKKTYLSDRFNCVWPFYGQNFIFLPKNRKRNNTKFPVLFRVILQPHCQPDGGMQQLYIWPAQLKIPKILDQLCC